MPGWFVHRFCQEGHSGLTTVEQADGRRINIRGQERIGMDGGPAFFREASDICDQLL
jgi:hypothetical protein